VPTSYSERTHMIKSVEGYGVLTSVCMFVGMTACIGIGMFIGSLLAPELVWIPLIAGVFGAICVYAGLHVRFNRISNELIDLKAPTATE